MAYEDHALVIQLRQGEYIVRIIDDPHLEKPVVITGSLDEARVWYKPGFVRKARSRAGRGGKILLIERDENGNRRILGKLVDGGQTECQETL